MLSLDTSLWRPRRHHAWGAAVARVPAQSKTFVAAARQRAAHVRLGGLIQLVAHAKRRVLPRGWAQFLASSRDRCLHLGARPLDGFVDHWRRSVWPRRPRRPSDDGNLVPE